MEKLLFACVGIGLPYIFINALISKEIFLWEPSPGKRIGLLLAVWLLPLFGAVIAYKSLDLDWFKNRKNTSNEQSNLSGGFLEMDSIFNPGARHVIEQRQKEHIEQTEDTEEEHRKNILLKEPEF